MKSLTTPLLFLAPAIVMLTACGGGSDSSDTAVAVQAAQAPAASSELTVAASAPVAQLTAAPMPLASPYAVTDSARIAAATATAQSATNACAPIRPFYWEIGNSAAKAASGSIKSSASTLTITATMPMSIASASKWIYGAYVVQKRNAALSSNDISLLSMRGGYTSFNGCLQNQTVDGCVAYGTNGVLTQSNVGKFDYGGGHMETHASLMGLGAMNNKTLAAAIQSTIGTDVPVVYSQSQLAGGVVTSADVYARFLRKVMTGQLKMGAMLGSNPVCTNKTTCPNGQAVYAPIPPTESWHYSIAHWIEDDPKVGDGALSSPGAFGFYPWIDASHSVYGIVARSVPGGAFDSVSCGRLIRKSWMTGNPS